MPPLPGLRWHFNSLMRHPDSADGATEFVVPICGADLWCRFVVQ